MNQKILNLALKAHLLNYIDNETPRVYFISGHAEPEEVETFTKLIIEDILKICEDHPSWSSQMIGQQIKNNFEV